MKRFIALLLAVLLFSVVFPLEAAAGSDAAWIEAAEMHKADLLQGEIPAAFAER